MRKGKKRNRAAQDMTLINLRALQKRVFNLECRERELYELYDRLNNRIETAMERIEFLFNERFRALNTKPAKKLRKSLQPGRKVGK